LTCNFTEMCSGSEAGSYLRLIDLCITQLWLRVIRKTCAEPGTILTVIKAVACRLAGSSISPFETVSDISYVPGRHASHW